MSGQPEVLVAANAASAAREFVAAASGFRLASNRLSVTADTLADPRTWDGAAAARFRAEHQRVIGHLRIIAPVLERVANAALAVIQSIDAEDAGTVIGPAHPAGGGAGPSDGAGSPRVYGWKPEDGVVVLNDKGAFQPDHGNDYNSTPSPGWRTAWEKMAYAEAIALASNIFPGTDAAWFFQHYLDGSGADLNFDSTVPYGESPAFAEMVDKNVQDNIKQADATGQNSFDSGYIYNNDSFPDNQNWTGAVKGCFHRVVGHRNPDGSWTVTLQITSYYQFVPGKDFGPDKLAKGAVLHDLERYGIAKDYHSIGTGTLNFDSHGNYLPTKGIDVWREFL